MNTIVEGLRPNDLKYLVSSYISIDQYTSKLDDDNITIAFFCNEMEVAEDLRDFIEKNFYIEIRDVEISDSLTEDNKYILFVELERNINFPKILMNLIDSINNVVGNEKWVFKTFNMNNKIDLTLDNLEKYVRLSKLRNNVSEEEIKNKSEVKESFKPITINDNGWIRKFKPIRYISKEELEQYIIESDGINKRDVDEIQLLENIYPTYQIISTDSNIFLIGNDKILMME